MTPSAGWGVQMLLLIGFVGASMLAQNPSLQPDLDFPAGEASLSPAGPSRKKADTPQKVSREFRVVLIPYPIQMHLSNGDEWLSRHSGINVQKLRYRIREDLLYSLGMEVGKSFRVFNLMFDTSGVARDLISAVHQSSRFQVQENRRYVHVLGYPADSVERWLRGTCPEAGPQEQVQDSPRHAGEHSSDHILQVSAYSVHISPEPREQIFYHTDAEVPEILIQRIAERYRADLVVILTELDYRVQTERCVDRWTGPVTQSFSVHYTVYDRTGKRRGGESVLAIRRSSSPDLYRYPVDYYHPIGERMREYLEGLLMRAGQKQN